MNSQRDAIWGCSRIAWIGFIKFIKSWKYIFQIFKKPQVFVSLVLRRCLHSKWLVAPMIPVISFELQVCNCHSVPKKVIREAIMKGAHTFEAVGTRSRRSIPMLLVVIPVSPRKSWQQNHGQSWGWYPQLWWRMMNPMDNFLIREFSERQLRCRFISEDWVSKEIIWRMFGLQFFFILSFKHIWRSLEKSTPEKATRKPSNIFKHRFERWIIPTQFDKGGIIQFLRRNSFHCHWTPSIQWWKFFIMGRHGAHQEIKKCTKAGTGCGTCNWAVYQTLVKSGIWLAWDLAIAAIARLGDHCTMDDPKFNLDEHW